MTTDDDLRPAPSPRSAIHTQTDMERTWRDLMEPLGFSGHSIWLMLVDADGVPIPQLSQIEDSLEPPDAAALAGLAELLNGLVTDVVPGGRVAFLRSRPGRGGPDARDRRWAAVLYDVCRSAGAPAEVVHVATDDTLTPVPWDALVAAGPAGPAGA